MNKILLTIFALIICATTYGQNTAIGDWEGHYSYASGKLVVDAGKLIFCSTYNGLFSINADNKKIKVYSKSDGLHDVGVSSMAYDEENHTLLVAYRSGDLDLLYLNEAAELTQVTHLPLFLNTADLPDHKKVYRIQYHEGLAYLASTFGIVVLDTKIGEVRESYRYIGPNGSEAHVSDLSFTQDSLFAVTQDGLIGTSLSATVNRQFYANWRRIACPPDLISLVTRNNTLYCGFSRQGLFKRQGSNWTRVHASPSSFIALSYSNNVIHGAFQDQLVSIDTNDKAVVYSNQIFTTVNALIRTSDNIIWTADQHNGLVGNPDNIFRSYSPSTGDTTITNRPDSSVFDQNDVNWSILPSSLGGGILVKDSKSNRQRILTTAPGNGALPSAIIHGLTRDNDGFIWFASERGVGYFIPDDVLASSQIDAIFPIYGQRKLLSNEKCTSIVTEPGNRKWIGTTTGLFLFNPDGTELIARFTSENCPLPTDMITALRFDAEKGLLFVNSPNGMVSYRSNATLPEANFTQVSIFPNPVHPGYTGMLGIKGLTVNCTVKITTLSGRLVFETASQGGTASWDLRDYTGRRANGGIYLIMAISEDKSAKFVGKFAIVD
jgi:hypothetical protein